MRFGAKRIGTDVRSRMPSAHSCGSRGGEGSRIIFLDCDGVLCCNRTALIELDKLQRLTSVVKRTGACIVLSTDWRRFPAFKSTLVEALSRMGLKVVGSTPLMASQRVRPLEISSWLRRRNEEARQTCWPLHSTLACVCQRPAPTPDPHLNPTGGRRPSHTGGVVGSNR